jgi:ubiquinone/menaquinone biosynthesis C-methylase UbiE
MSRLLKKAVHNLFNLFGFDIVRVERAFNPPDCFHSADYLRHNQRRQEHLASLKLEIIGSTVLEVGAGIGDHTSFFIDRNCQVVTSEAREENLRFLRQRYPGLKVLQLDLDNPPERFDETFDIIYCYGVLYHLKNPSNAIGFMARCCKKMLLLETCVSFKDKELLNLCSENRLDPSQAIGGTGCRPTRKWIYDQLKQYFDYVYLPITQPCHEEFPTDWYSPSSHKSSFARAVFIASRAVINNELLTEEMPMIQKRSS